MGTYSDPRKNQKKSITNNKAQTKKKKLYICKKADLSMSHPANDD